MGLARFALPAALAGVAAGILAADALGAVPGVGAIAAGGALLLCAVLASMRLAPLGILGVALIGAGIGAWRAEGSLAPVGGPSSVARLVDGGEHELIGTVVDDPRPRGDRLQLALGDVWVARDGALAPLSDRLLGWLPRGIDASSGDRLRIRAEVELAEDFDGFAYREYLERQGIGAIARVRAAEVLPGAGGPAQALAGSRDLLLGGLNDVVPEPEAALGAGILLGVRASIAPEINDAFATAGLTHVVAISGWNIAIVAALVAAVVSPLSSRPGGRWTTSLVAASTVGGYVMLTGASPSVVRAALMAGAMLVGRLGGSRANAASALTLAALVMLLAAPPVLWDVGFQLSLLATAGLIWFGASVERRLSGWPAWIREPVALTLAAQLTTLPVVLLNFERLSLVAPLANVLVVPFVPVAMLFSALASLVGVLDGGASPAPARRRGSVAGRRRGLADPARRHLARDRGRLGAAGGGRRPGAARPGGGLVPGPRPRRLGAAVRRAGGGGPGRRGAAGWARSHRGNAPFGRCRSSAAWSRILVVHHRRRRGPTACCT